MEMKLLFPGKLIIIFVILVFMITILCYNFLADSKYQGRHNSKKVPKAKKFQNKAQQPADRFVLPERIVHLDLKGAPPKVIYFSELFPLLKNLGATGVLLEYEDMFPYSGPFLNNISALNAYSIQDIDVINSLARIHKLKVIPFVQTFRHLEFLLKLEEYSEYREIWNLPSTICPSYSKSSGVLQEMIQQLIDAHPNSNMIHIGCDEVPHLGQCQRCFNRMLSEKLTKNDIFVGHIHSIISYIKRRNPSMEILIWDDHFRSLKTEDIQKEKASLMDSFKPVIWWYGKDVYDELGPSLWSTYSNVFPRIWIASAYKGIVGSNSYISDVNRYIQNHNSWISVIEEYHNKIQFNGIILTGRQRYDHFAVLCELLPVGIPALAMSLRLLQGFHDSSLGPPLEVAKILDCEQPYGLIGSAFGSPKCKFPGGDVLENIIHFHQLKQEFDEILEDFRVKGWMSDFNKKYSFSNPEQIKTVVMSLDKIKEDLGNLKTRISFSMLKIYNEYTVSEWMDTYLLPFQQQVVSLWEMRQKILEKVYFPRGPVNFDKQKH